MKLHEIEFIDGEKWIDKFGHIWEVNQKEFRKQKKNRIESITDGRYALGLLVCMDFQPYVEYVSFEKAIEHMKTGLHAKKDGVYCRIITKQIEYDGKPIIQGYFNGKWKDCVASLELLEDKWELI